MKTLNKTLGVIVIISALILIMTIIARIWTNNYNTLLLKIALTCIVILFFSILTGVVLFANNDLEDTE